MEIIPIKAIIAIIMDMLVAFINVIIIINALIIIDAIIIIHHG